MTLPMFLFLQKANDVRSTSSAAALASIIYCYVLLDEDLAAAGISQHRSKAKILPTLIGQGPYNSYKHFLSDSTSRASGTHLGGMRVYNNYYTFEVAARIRAMWGIFTLGFVLDEMQSNEDDEIIVFITHHQVTGSISRYTSHYEHCTQSTWQDCHTSR